MFGLASAYARPPESETRAFQVAPHKFNHSRLVEPERCLDSLERRSVFPGHLYDARCGLGAHACRSSNPELSSSYNFYKHPI